MARAPTNKSRAIAFIGMMCITTGLVLDGWFSPPLPPVGIPVLSLVAVVMMQFAKQTREADGKDIPASVMKDGAWISNVEIFLAVICGLCIIATLGIEMSGASKQSQQVVTAGTLVLFVITAVVFQFTRLRFDALMRAAAADPHAPE